MPATQLRAFVISPIGGTNENGRDARGAYADEVFDRIINPACRLMSKHGFDVVPVRGEQDRSKTDIIERFVGAINRPLNNSPGLADEA